MLQARTAFMAVGAENAIIILPINTGSSNKLITTKYAIIGNTINLTTAISMVLRKNILLYQIL